MDVATIVSPITTDDHASCPIYHHYQVSRDNNNNKHSFTNALRKVRLALTIYICIQYENEMKTVTENRNSKDIEK